MSDLANRAKLAQSDAQLPVTAYFGDALLQQEMKLLFGQGPRYVGHELMVPNVGDFATLAWENEGRMLVRNAQRIELLSNVCRHRQAKCWMAVAIRSILFVRCIAGLMTSRANFSVRHISTTRLA